MTTGLDTQESDNPGERLFMVSAGNEAFVIKETKAEAEAWIEWQGKKQYPDREFYIEEI